MKSEPLKGKTQYTASVFKDVEREYGVNFVGKELYEKIGKDKTFGMELFMKEDVRSAINYLVQLIDSEGNAEGNSFVSVGNIKARVKEAFPDVREEEDRGR